MKKQTTTPEKKKGWMSGAFDGLWTLTTVVSDLGDLARALRFVGNQKLSDDLFDLSGVIEEARKSIKDSISENLTEQISESNKSAAATLSFVLEAAARSRTVEIDGELRSVIVTGGTKEGSRSRRILIQREAKSGR